MINTEKVIGFYTDVFGNEINEYEQIERYSAFYKGKIFEGDKNGLNEVRFDNFEDAMAFYHSYPDVTIKDNEYDMYFANNDWY